ncbi:MAG: sulfotransferase [Anaerolineales bacterium]
MTSATMRDYLQAVKRRLQTAHHSLRGAMLSWGLLPGRLDYVKFIILGRSRTGSNYLRGLLSSIEGVLVLGEILKNPVSVEWGTDEFPRSEGVDRGYRADPVRFLEQDVFRTLPDSIHALGFKLFYYHAQNPPFKRTWDYLRDRQEVRVIHIKRRNVLATHLSRARAVQSDQWVATSKPDSGLGPIKLEYSALLEDFQQTRDWELHYDLYFADHPMLEVHYEDLARERDVQMRRIQAFLGLPLVPTQPQTYKQSRKSLRDSISNFQELSDRFRGSDWESFFAEEDPDSRPSG